MSLAPVLQVSAGNLTTGALPRDPKAPELLVAINTCPVPPGEDVPQLDPGKASSVEAILAQIWKRLTGGLDAVWQSPDGHDPEWEPRPAGAQAAPPAEEIQAEESWARCCAELLDLTPYGGASTYSGAMSDGDFYNSFKGDNPVVPVVMACQQLCTYAILSRGYSPLDISWKEKDPDTQKVKIRYGISAGHNSTVGHLFEGGWDKKPVYADIHEALGRAAGGLKPGSIFGFLPEGSGQKQGAHVVFVLRVAKAVGKVQFLDTGAARTSSGSSRSARGSSNYAMSTFGLSGNYDNMLVEGKVSVTTGGGSTRVPYVGLGVLKPTPVPEMVKAVAHARRARPFGLARLAIFRRTGGKVEDKDILYVSPRLLMHDTTSEHNFYLSRYLWSLRAVPGYQNLQAMWQISIPQGELIKKMKDPTRDVPLSTIWESVTLQDIAYLTVDPTGQAACISRYKAELQPDGKTTKPVQEPKVGLDLYGAVKGRLDRTPAGEDFVSGALAGALNPPHDYFKRWSAGP